MPDGSSVSGKTEDVITENNLRSAFSVSVCIGTHMAPHGEYKYIIPVD